MAASYLQRPKYVMKSNSSSSLHTQHTQNSSTPLIPDMIIPNLYLTDLFTARGVLQPSFAGPGRPNIKYILSLLDNSVSQPKPKPVNMDKFVQKLIILDDTPDADLLVRLNECCNWIDECFAANDGGVLVHCHMGQSRSASIVIAYVMRKLNLDYEKALVKVKYRRNMVKPNVGFAKQLQLWNDMGRDISEPDPEAPDGETVMRKKEWYMNWKKEQKLRIEKLLTP